MRPPIAVPPRGSPRPCALAADHVSKSLPDAPDLLQVQDPPGDRDARGPRLRGLRLDRRGPPRGGIWEYEAVHIWNITRGTRIQTYAIKGERGSGVICINGAAAHLNKPGDLVILATFAELDEAEARTHAPIVVLVDRANKIVDKDAIEVAGPARRVTA
jgi:aspartate 1-decarboxylase